MTDEIINGKVEECIAYSSFYSTRWISLLIGNSRRLHAMSAHSCHRSRCRVTRVGTRSMLNLQVSGFLDSKSGGGINSHAMPGGTVAVECIQVVIGG